MVNKTNFDYIIVGQGIAGSVLAYSLLKEKKKVLVIDEPALSSSSKIAAGLYNPVVFKRLVKSWKIDELLPFADSYYSEAELFFNETFYFKKSIIKIFTEENEKDFWLKKTKTDLGKYLSNEITKVDNTKINNELGGAEVKDSGYLNVSLFIQLVENYLRDKKLLINEKFDFSAFTFSNQTVKYRRFTANKIIFCEGHRALENPHFKWLPFKLTKGEILTIKIDHPGTEKIINKGVFVLPIGNNLFKVGATYEWNNLDEIPSEKGKDELIGKLNKILTVPYQIIEHKAGIRPTVVDRRPLVGIHPQHNSIAIFNGMGTKGVMLSPFFAKQLIDFLEYDKPLGQEVNIDRFEK